jgi:hypothetical protein
MMQHRAGLATIWRLAMPILTAIFCAACGSTDDPAEEDRGGDGADGEFQTRLQAEDVNLLEGEMGAFHSGL